MKRCAIHLDVVALEEIHLESYLSKVLPSE
jgi:hypothetical protein